MNFPRVQTQAFLISIASLFLVSSQKAGAAQIGQVIKAQASLVESPSASGKVVTHLKIQSKVSVSDTPSQGFYRARAATGEIGWISAQDIHLLGRLPGESPVSTASPSESLPIGSTRFNLEASTEWSDAIGLGVGAGAFYRVARIGGHSFELGLQTLIFAFNAASPLEIDGALRYWFGRGPMEAGFELYLGTTLLLNPTLAGLGGSMEYGPGFFLSYAAFRGARVYGGFREDLSSQTGRHVLFGLAFYF